MSFIPRTFGGLAGGLIDGKPGAFSNAGAALTSPISPLRGTVQRMVDKTGVNGRFDQNGVGFKSGLQNDGNALPTRRLSGRGSSSLSV